MQQSQDLDEIYRSRPELRDYYVSLPGPVRMMICRHDARLTTLGELQTIGEHMRREWEQQQREYPQ